MNNKYYSCPFCQQTSSRKWNLQVHLIRKHHGVGSPLENNRDERSSGAHNKYSSKRILPFTEGQENIGETGPASYILKGLHEFLEIESLLDKLYPSRRTSAPPNAYVCIKLFPHFRGISRYINVSKLHTKDGPVKTTYNGLRALHL